MKAKIGSLIRVLLTTFTLLLPLSAQCFYNRTTGAWLSRDPVEESGGLNLYGFVENSPQSFVDTSGLRIYPASFIGPLLPGDFRSAPPGRLEDSGGRLIEPARGLDPGQLIDAGLSFVDPLTGGAASKLWFGNPPPGFASGMIPFGPGSSECNVRLFRYRNGAESAQRLARKAAEAEEKLGVHGVSTSTKDLGEGSESASAAEVQEAFEVQQTGSDPNHHTIILPKPVTPQTANQFNSLFSPRN